MYRGTEAGLPYLIAAPASRRAKDRLRPVLCFLHGYDEGAPTEVRTGLTRHGPLRARNPARVEQDFIILAPQLPARGDRWHLHGNAVRGMVRAAQEEHAGDPRRTYLTGFSFGGNGVFDLALAQPELWAALWAVDPTRVPARDPERPVWLSFGEVARHAKADFIRALRLEPYAQDAVGDRVYLDEGADHVGSATRAYADPRIYSWLLSSSRSADEPQSP